MELLELTKPIVEDPSNVSIKEDRILATDQIDQQPNVLLIDGVGKLSKGNISAWSGRAKSKKTFALSLTLAGLVTGQSIHELFKPCGQGLAWCDTEQSPFDAQRVVKRIKAIAGTEDGLYFYQLRRYGAKIRRQKVKAVLDANKGNIDLLVVDGVRDLVIDFNDPVESSEMVTDLMAWSVDYNVHIAVVLHANKGDGFMRGHLGTELENKSEAVFTVDKDEHINNVSKVTEQFGRGKGVEPFSIKINSQGLPEVVEDMNEFTGLNDSNKAPWDK